jgi:hypothetical protein
MTDPVVIRASSTTMFTDCPRRWVARHLRRMLENDFGFVLNDAPVHIGAPIGTGVHAGVAHALKAKMAQGYEPPFSDVQDAAIDGYGLALAEAEQGVSWDAATARSNNEAEQQVARMVRVAYDQLLPMVDPLAVEDRLEAEIEPGFIVSGQRDVYAYVLLPSGGTGLVDVKTGLKADLHAPQLGTYALLGATNGNQIDRADVFFIPRKGLRHAQPDAEWISVPIAVAERASMATLMHIVAAIKQFHETRDPHTFLASPASKLCGSKFCPAFGAGDWCQEHRREI